MTKRHKRRHKSGEHGFSMLEVIIAAALLAIVVVATSTYLVTTTQDARAQTVREMQRRVYENIRIALENPDALLVSSALLTSPGNSMLKVCIDAKDGAPCPAQVTNVGGQRQFDLYTRADAGTPAERIAGTTNNPVRYSNSGEANGCMAAGESCRFGAVAYFWATCDLSAANVPNVTCARPAALNVRVQVIPLSQTKVIGGSPTSAYPPSNQFGVNTDAFSMSIKMTDIYLRNDETCPINQVQSGYNVNGTPKCLCANGRPVTGGVCPAQTCATGYSMTGFNPNGTIHCVPPDSPERCWDISLSDPATKGDCGVGAWLVRVTYGACNAVSPGKHGKAGSVDIIDCDSDTGRCCMDFL